MHFPLAITIPLLTFGLAAASSSSPSPNTPSNNTNAIPTPELFKRGCNADNCARAITGTVFGPACVATHRQDCSSLLGTASIYPAITSTSVRTVLATITTKAKTNSVTNAPTINGSGKVVTYVSACSGASRWASACSCWGITPAAATGGAASTVTSIVEVTSTIVVG